MAVRGRILPALPCLCASPVDVVLSDRGLRRPGSAGGTEGLELLKSLLQP